MSHLRLARDIEADLTDCFNIEPRHLGAEIVGRESALIWKSMIRSRCFSLAHGEVYAEEDRDLSIMTRKDALAVFAGYDPMPNGVASALLCSRFLHPYDSRGVLSPCELAQSAEQAPIRCPYHRVSSYRTARRDFRHSSTPHHYPE